MLARLALIYGASWLAAVLCAACIEAMRLSRLKPLPPALDIVGAVAMAWLSAPVAAPILAFNRLRGLRRGRAERA